MSTTTSIDFTNIPYVIRRRFYELSTPLTIYKLRQTCKNVFNELKFIGVYFDEVHIGRDVSDNLVDFNDTQLFLILPDTLMASLLSPIKCRRAVIYCVLSISPIDLVKPMDPNFVTYINIQGPIRLNHLRKIINRLPNLDSFTFVGNICNIQKETQLLDLISHIKKIHIALYWNTADISSIQSEITLWNKKRKEKVEDFVFYLTHRTSEGKNGYCSIKLEGDDFVQWNLE